MLLWLQKKLPKSIKLWTKLIGITTGVHACLLFMLFFIYKGDNANLRLEINQHLDTNALVVFMPLHKKVTNTHIGKKNSAGKKVIPQKQVTKKPLLLAKNEKVPTALAQEKKTKPVAKKAIKKPCPKKDTKKSEVKKTKEELKPKDEPKKEEPKPEIKEQPKQEEPKKDELDLKTTDTQTSEIPEGENIRYVGQNDLDALFIQNSLTQTIAQHWKPPVGISKNKVCELLLVVDWHGKVKEIKVQKSSGAAMYDVSARTAALAAEYPKALWGKACTITFKQ